MGTTPIYGFPYPDPSDLVANYPALGQTLAEDVENVIDGLPAGGLSPCPPTTIANSGGSASTTGNTTTFTTVTSLSLNGVFTDDFNYYKIVTNLLSSTTNNISYRHRAAGSDSAGTTYSDRRAALGAAYSTGGNTGITSGSFMADVPTSSCISVTEFGGVRTAGQKSTVGFHYTPTNTISFLVVATANTSATIFDGITFLTSTGTMTGIVSVYGYSE
jgi:hypothetical protein